MTSGREPLEPEHPYRSPAPFVAESDPFPTTSNDGRIAFLQDLANWMRGAGATRARLPDGTELELGERPPTQRPEDTPEQATARRRSILREELETRYAHVGGWHGSDDELDAFLGARP